MAWFIVAAAGLLVGCVIDVVLGDNQNQDGYTRQVAYHRVCCRQDADVTVGKSKKLLPALENIIQQFDSDFCLHDFGIGTSVSKEEAKDWPHVTREEGEGFHNSYYRSLIKRRSRSSSGERHRSSSLPRGERDRSSSRPRGERDRPRSRDRGTKKDMKCATVEVFFRKSTAVPCPIKVFTPDFIAHTAMKNFQVRIGTGKGQWWNGKTVGDYVENKNRLEFPELEFPKDHEKVNRCESIITKPVIEYAVNLMARGSSLTAEAVVRFFEYATNSRAPISNTFLRKGELEFALTREMLEQLDIPIALEMLCEEMGREYGEDCLRSVPIEQLKLDFEASSSRSQKSSIRFPKGIQFPSRKGKSRARRPSTVNLVLLMSEENQKKLLKVILPFRKQIDSKICDYGGNARLLEFVLMKAFGVVTGMSYADLHNRVMKEQLNTGKHWMLAACAEKLVIKTEVPKSSKSRFLHEYFQYELQGTFKVQFVKGGTLEDIDTQPPGIWGPTAKLCAVLAGELKSLETQIYDEIDVWIAYFTRDKDGKDQVFRSAAQNAPVWGFLRSAKAFSLGDLLLEARTDIRIREKCPPYDGSEPEKGTEFPDQNADIVSYAENIPFIDDESADER